MKRKPYSEEPSNERRAFPRPIPDRERKRPERADGAFKRPERAERPDRADRPARPPRPQGDRLDRAASGKRPERKARPMSRAEGTPKPFERAAESAVPHRKKPSADTNARREVKVYGLHACLALFKQRPNDIIRVYCEEGRVAVLSALLRWCAAHKKAYHIIPDEEMAKVTGSIHHEGVCVLATQPNTMTFDQLLAAFPKMGKNICLLYLDDIQNPHNVGSILRICAHFGVAYVLGDAAKFPELTPSGYRIAKGGAEAVQLIPLPDSKKAFQQLKDAGFALVGSSSHTKTSLYQYKFPSRTVLALGAEGTGLSPQLMKEVTTVLQIPGSGEVESLNVAIASALFLGEYWRQTQA